MVEIAVDTKGSRALIPKVALLRMSRQEFERSQAEALDGREDIACRLAAPERFGVLVERFDLLGNSLL